MPRNRCITCSERERDALAQQEKTVSSPQNMLILMSCDIYMTIPKLMVLISWGLPWGEVRLSGVLKPGMTNSDISVGWYFFKETVKTEEVVQVPVGSWASASGSQRGLNMLLMYKTTDIIMIIYWNIILKWRGLTIFEVLEKWLKEHNWTNWRLKRYNMWKSQLYNTCAIGQLVGELEGCIEWK